MLVVQTDACNRSQIGTVIVVALATSIRLLDAPGHVLLTRKASGVVKDSVVNVSQLLTLDRTALVERVARATRRDGAGPRRVAVGPGLGGDQRERLSW